MCEKKDYMHNKTMFDTKNVMCEEKITCTVQQKIRGRPDKYLASPPEGATIAREIYYRVVHSRRRLLNVKISVESDS